MQIEIVALDLDGTLLGENGRLLRRNAQAIAEVRARGVDVILATGKTYWSAVDLIASLKLTLPGVFSQGLIICEADGTIMRQITFDDGLVNRMLAYLESEGLPYIAYNLDGTLSPYEDPYNDVIVGRYREPAPIITGALAGRAQEFQINKLLVGDRQDIAARSIDFTRRFGQEATVMYTVPEYVDVLPLGVTKGSGVSWLLQRLGIRPEVMMAMGDGINDIGMLQMAGLGVAVGNAAPELKAVADAVVSSNVGGGVAEALHRYVLSGE